MGPRMSIILRSMQPPKLHKDCEPVKIIFSTSRVYAELSTTKIDTLEIVSQNITIH